MSLKGKNRNFFSYTNENRIGSNFQFKDFEKTKSYNTNFSKSNFTGVSFRAAHMKYCNFTNCQFNNVDFVGTNLRGCRFYNAVFSNCIFVGVNLDRAKFTGAKFEHCYFVHTSLLCLEKQISNCNDDGIIVLEHYPSSEEYGTELLQAVEELRKNDIIRRSNVLHCKKNKINTLTLKILREQYSEETLIPMIKVLPEYITTQFYTISYLKVLLTKISKDIKI
ncbi:MAG: pentapeptide repeat-containing protein [Firmicutes bacterium]|nr:pentapeptide repeat-containing protein [Bacillota bacterium]